MAKKILFLTILITLVLFILPPDPARADSDPLLILSGSSLLPENTIVLSNALDGRFSRDFSTLLKHTRLEWVVLESPAVPEAIRDQNLILLGGPDSPHSAEIIQALLTAEELGILEAGGNQGSVYEIESPWTEDRTVIICWGEGPIGIRNGAETALRALIADSPPTSDWIQTTYQAPPDEQLQSFVETLQYTWEDQELTIEELTMDVNAKTEKRISSEEALEDAERLAYLFSHGYGGFGFFNKDGEIDQAWAAIREDLASQSSWTVKAFSNILQEHLSFITDCHLDIGDHSFAEHSDFWYDTQYELTMGKDGFQFLSEGDLYLLVSINGGDPDPYLYPSLNQSGDAIYRLGTLSPAQPPDLEVVGLQDGAEKTFSVHLKHSNFDYYAEDIFQEDLIGGVPVIRARGFGDYHQEILRGFPPTATQLRGDPVVVVDLRGNTGGNESWPIDWIQRLTGERPHAVFVTAELKSKTSMMGRANAFDYWIQTAGVDSYESDLAHHTHIVQSIEDGKLQASWTRPIYPPLPLIPNKTTVVVVTNDRVASAGEGFVMRVSQAENVLVVGENTMGCLTFGNISAHKLPQSQLMIWMPINFGIFLDGQILEGVGLVPDLWVPAADAVNYAVAALRAGTISTEIPLSQETLDAKFTPESPWDKALDTMLSSWPIIVIFISGGVIWSYSNRQKPIILLIVGFAWILFGGYMVMSGKGKAIYYGLIMTGIISLTWGLIGLIRKRRGHLIEEGES